MDEIDSAVREKLIFHFVDHFDEIPHLVFREQETRALPSEQPLSPLHMPATTSGVTAQV